MGSRPSKYDRVRRIAAAATGATAALAPLTALGGSLVYWDPSPSPGIQGGSGVWSTGASNWDNAGVRTAWNNAGNDTAVFSGTPGGSLQFINPVTAGSLQFDAAGFQIGLASPIKVLTLSSGSVVANADAAVVAPLSTPAGFVKSGAGVLTLTGGNTFRGTVTILGGAVAFAAEGNLGAATNGVRLSGGRLQYVGASALSMTPTRTILVDAGGGAFDTTAGTLQLGGPGQVTGAGALAKLGAGSLRLTNANTTFTGAVQVTAGTLILEHPSAVNGAPVTLAGGKLALRSDSPVEFQSNVTVTADASVEVNRATILGMSSGYLGLGNVAVNAGATLSVGADFRNHLAVSGLDLGGALRLNDTAAIIRGAFSGGGTVVFGAVTQPPELFTSGLIFANGMSQTIAGGVAADDAAGGRALIGVDAGTTLTYNGTWQAGGASAQSSVVLRNGGKFVAGPAAHLNTTTADVAAARPFTVIGLGAADNTFELDAGFVADHTLGATTADGLSSLEVRDATLITRASQSLPVIVKHDGFGGTHRAGGLIFSGTSGAKWVVGAADQQYDGGVTFNSSATVQADKDLNHIGSVANKSDGQFQIPTAGVTLTKTGSGWLNLSGSQGYAAGSTLSVQGGGVRFNTDPGAGFYPGNFARGADGNVVSPPAPAGTLAVTVDGSTGAAVEFAAPVSRVASIAVTAGGTVRVTFSPPGQEKGLVTGSLSVAAGARLDLDDNRLIVDYDAASTPLASVAARVKAGFNAGGARWQGSGIVSSAAAADPGMGIGYAEASDVLRLSGNQTGMFGGQTIDATSVLVRFTRLGDANLDGRVSIADFQRLEIGFGKSGQGWSAGDFNYDGEVDMADFKLLYDNFGQGIPSLAPTPIDSLAADVPEPGLSGALFVGGMAALGVRQRRGRFRNS